MLPENLLYTREHEWLLIENDTALIGITEYAQEELGDITYAELPAAEETFKAGDSPVTLESVKAVSSVYCPFDCEITEVNQALLNTPEIINTSPYSDGWILKVRITGDVPADLMSPQNYKDYLEELD